MRARLLIFCHKTQADHQLARPDELADSIPFADIYAESKQSLARQEILPVRPVWSIFSGFESFFLNQYGKGHKSFTKLHQSIFTGK